MHRWRSGAEVEQWHASSERDALLERLAVVADRRSRPQTSHRARDTLEDVPLLLRSAIFPLVQLSLMTFFVMPFVARMLHGWLFPHGPHG